MKVVECLVHGQAWEKANTFVRQGRNALDGSSYTLMIVDYRMNCNVSSLRGEQFLQTNVCTHDSDIHGVFV